MQLYEVTKYVLDRITELRLSRDGLTEAQLSRALAVSYTHRGRVLAMPPIVVIPYRASFLLVAGPTYKRSEAGSGHTRDR